MNSLVALLAVVLFRCVHCDSDPFPASEAQPLFFAAPGLPLSFEETRPGLEDVPWVTEKLERPRQIPEDPSLPKPPCATCAFQQSPVWAYRGLCPPDSYSNRLPKCANVGQASSSGHWIRSPVKVDAGLGTYSEWCWRPMTCHMPVMTRLKAQECLSGRKIAVLGDSNSGHLYNSFVGFLEAKQEATVVHNPLNNITVAQKYLGVPADDFVSEFKDLEARRFVTPVHNITLEYVRYLFAKDWRIVTRLGPTTIDTIKAYHWGKAAKTPDILLMNVGVHDTKLIYPLPHFHRFHSRVYPVDPVTGQSMYVVELERLMLELKVVKNVTWFLTPAIDVGLQEAPYHYTTSNRRASLINSWARALSEHHGFSVFDTFAVTASEMPELHTDGVHVHAYHDAYYHAARDMILAHYCE
jgi:hypothetical protein